MPAPRRLVLGIACCCLVAACRDRTAPGSDTPLIPAAEAPPAPGDAQPSAAPGAPAETPGSEPCLGLKQASVQVTAQAGASLAVALESAGTYAFCAAAGDEAVDPTIAVFDAKGKTLAENDDYRNRNYAAALVRVQGPETVTLAVGCYEDKAGPVDLRIQRVGWLEPGGRVTGELTDFDQWDWYGFRAEANTLYRLATGELGEGCDTALALHTLGDHRIMAQADDVADDDLSSELHWRCHVTGLYYFCVTASVPSGLGRYTVSLNYLAEQ